MCTDGVGSKLLLAEEMDSIQAQKALKRSESETAEIEAQYELKNDQRIIEIISDDEV